MARKRIIVDGKPVQLSNHQEYNDYINRKRVECLEDTNGTEIGGFDSLDDSGTYRLGPPVQPRPSNFHFQRDAAEWEDDTSELDTPAQINSIYTWMKLQQEEEKTLVISNPSVSGFNRAIDAIGIVPDAPDWEPDEDTKRACHELGSNMAPFYWDATKNEDSKDNRRQYMAYLRSSNLCLPDGSQLFDAVKSSAFLSVRFLPSGIKTRGNIDVVMAANRHQGIHTAKRHMWAAIELKKQENNATEEIHRQVVLQHLSASFLNKDTGILTIMTDLGPRWNFYWFSSKKNALMEYAATSKGEANYLIRHMMKAPDASSAPTDFLNRASWNQMFPQRMEGGAIMEKGEGEDEGEDEGDSNDDGGNNKRGSSGSPEKKQVRSCNDGLPQESHDSRSSEGAGGTRKTMHGTSHSLDFMDEEEEMEATFMDVLECLLPQLEFSPSYEQLQQRKPSDGPPRQIELS